MVTMQLYNYVNMHYVDHMYICFYYEYICTAALCISMHTLCTLAIMHTILCMCTLLSVCIYSENAITLNHNLKCSWYLVITMVTMQLYYVYIHMLLWTSSIKLKYASNPQCKDNLFIN